MAARARPGCRARRGNTAPRASNRGRGSRTGSLSPMDETFWEQPRRRDLGRDHDPGRGRCSRCSSTASCSAAPSGADRERWRPRSSRARRGPACGLIRRLRLRRDHPDRRRAGAEPVRRDQAPRDRDPRLDRRARPGHRLRRPQTVIANFVAGVLMAIRQPIRIGDLITDRRGPPGPGRRHRPHLHHDRPRRRHAARRPQREGRDTRWSSTTPRATPARPVTVELWVPADADLEAARKRARGRPSATSVAPRRAHRTRARGSS